jgi:hypothetical protein
MLRLSGESIRMKSATHPTVIPATVIRAYKPLFAAGRNDRDWQILLQK